MDEQQSESQLRLEAERTEALESIQDAVLSLETSEALAEKAGDTIDWEAQHAKLDYQIRFEKKKRRERWDTVLAYLVIAGFFFSYAFIVLIGFHIMNFDNNAFAVPSVVAAGVLETYGLAKLAIKYFFNDDDMHSK